MTGTLNLLGFLACVAATLVSVTDTSQDAGSRARRGVLFGSRHVSKPLVAGRFPMYIAVYTVFMLQHTESGQAGPA